MGAELGRGYGLRKGFAGGDQPAVAGGAFFWVARLLQIVLVIGALEWIRTLVVFATARAAAGQSWTRLAVILGVVALLTLVSAMVFQGASLSRRYRLHPNRL